MVTLTQGVDMLLEVVHGNLHTVDFQASLRKGFVMGLLLKREGFDEYDQYTGIVNRGTLVHRESRTDSCKLEDIVFEDIVGQVVEVGNKPAYDPLLPENWDAVSDEEAADVDEELVQGFSSDDEEE